MAPWHRIIAKSYWALKNKGLKGVKRNPGWNVKHKETFSLYHQHVAQPHPGRWDTELREWTGVGNVKLKKKPSVRQALCFSCTGICMGIWTSNSDTSNRGYWTAKTEYSSGGWWEFKDKQGWARKFHIAVDYELTFSLIEVLAYSDIYRHIFL